MADTLVIVVTYNSARWLDRCLGSVAESSHPADAIVIDNSSSDGTPDLVAAGWPQFKLVRNSENSGFGAANNIGFKYALEKGYRYVYLLNSDAWLERDTLEVLIKAFEMGDCCWGILSPVQKDAAGKLDKNFEKKCGKYLRPGSVAGEPVEVPFVMAAHWLMTTDAIRKTGGFSPIFKQYGEDDNYIDRLHYNGLKCGIVQSASAVHDRAFRTLTRAQRMKLKTVSSLVRVSNPGRCFNCVFFKEVFWLIGMGIKNLSIQPWKFINVLIDRKPELQTCVEISRNPGSFLQ